MTKTKRTSQSIQKISNKLKYSNPVFRIQENDARIAIRQDQINAVPPELREYVVDQEHKEYSNESLQVWQLILAQKEYLFKYHASCLDQEYILGFNKMGLSSTKIPFVLDINEALNTIGWSAVCVAGYLPPMIYAKFIENKIFPIARDIRHLKHINNAPLPDFIHDVTGHLPMLFSQEYRSFLCRIIVLMARAPGNDLDAALFLSAIEWGKLKNSLNPSIIRIQALETKMKHIVTELKKKPSILTQLNRMFLWSIELGVLGNIKNYRCYGAGILSSPLELEAVYKKSKKIIPYSMAVIHHEINYSSLQDQFFVIQDYDQLQCVLNQYLMDYYNIH